MSTPALQAARLEVGYRGVAALGPVELTVQPGEIVSILGPSGCGKSTLLAAIAGLAPIQAGEILRSSAGPAGLVFQDPTLAPWLSALDNVALPLELGGAGRAAAKAQAQAGLDRVGLGAFASAKPAALSGGMRMRVSLARALAPGPELLLLDEPFAAIDEIGRRDLDALVLALRAERGFATLFVTHSVEEACLLGDRVIVLSPRPGRILGEIALPGGARDDDFMASAPCVEAMRRARGLLRQPAGGPP